MGTFIAYLLLAARAAEAAGYQTVVWESDAQDSLSVESGCVAEDDFVSALWRGASVGFVPSDVQLQLPQSDLCDQLNR